MASLVIGSRGQDVAALQALLQKMGYRVAVDGAFGAETQTAVLEAQKRLGLMLNGAVDEYVLTAFRNAVGASGGGAAWQAPTPEALVPASNFDVPLPPGYQPEAPGAGLQPLKRPGNLTTPVLLGIGLLAVAAIMWFTEGKRGKV